MPEILLHHVLDFFVWIDTQNLIIRINGTGLTLVERGSGTAAGDSCGDPWTREKLGA